MEIKIITFVIELGVKSIVALYNEGQAQVICRSSDVFAFQQLGGRGKSL